MFICRCSLQCGAYLLDLHILSVNTEQVWEIVNKNMLFSLQVKSYQFIHIPLSDILLNSKIMKPKVSSKFNNGKK